MRVLIAGDTHADANAARTLAVLAERHEVNEIWQCGDLGWWPRTDGGSRFTNLLGLLPVPLYFADGNHEDHDRLLHDAPAEYEIATNVWYVPRGVVRTLRWGDFERRVMFFGGARSVDRVHRRAGISWFSDELPNHRQWSRAETADPVDVVVAHDSPHWMEYGYPPHHLSFWPMEDLLVSEQFRRMLTNLSERVRPRLWFNGHHHTLRRGEQNGLQVWSLAESSVEPSRWTVVLDLETMEVSRG